MCSRLRRHMTLGVILTLVCQDVAEALGYSNPQEAVRVHVDEYEPEIKRHRSMFRTQDKVYAHFPPKLSEGFLKFSEPVSARYTPSFSPTPLKNLTANRLIPSPERPHHAPSPRATDSRPYELVKICGFMCLRDN